MDNCDFINTFASEMEAAAAAAVAAAWGGGGQHPDNIN